MPGASVAVDRRRGHHEVSILTAAGTGVGRCFGSQPRAKVSMMNMRPPQPGHGRGSMQGSSAIGACGVSGGLEGAGILSSDERGKIVAALEAIRAETERSMQQTLGEKGWQSYNKPNNTWWLRNLSPPMPAATATPH